MRKHLATFVEDFECHGKQIAVVSYPGNRRVATSYAELAALAGRFSRLLADNGISPGERVLLWGANSAEWVAAFFGCVLRGVIAVPLDAAGGVEFATRVIAETAPRWIAGDSELLQRLPNSASKFYFEDSASSLPLDPLLVPESSLSPETPLQILYTSGTTSAPKGIVHTHGNVLASVEVLEREIKKYLRYERRVHPLRFLHTLPLSHVFGQFMGLWVPPLLAAEVHYEDKLVANHLIQRIRRERISLAAVVPRVLELMRADLLANEPQLQQRLTKVQHRRIWWRWWHLRDLHRRFGFKFWAFVSGGATLPQDIEQFWNALGFVLIQGYGMTETTALATLNHPLHTSRGSIGRPLEGREVRVAEDGEILVRGAMLAAGTWRNGQIEARREDWLHTGDLGSVDTTGNVHFLGRKSDVIVAASGMNIHPADLEAAVCAQPGVRECMVVGWNGPRGAEPVAVVMLNEHLEGNNDEQALPQILAGANRGLQEFQQIRSALEWPTNEFPRNTIGKLLRREVAAWVQQQLAATSPATTLGSNSDPLLRLLQQAAGESVNGLDNSAELHLDSLGRMQLAMGIEEQLGVSVSDNDMAAAKTLGDLRKLLRPVQAPEENGFTLVHPPTQPKHRVPHVSPLRRGITEQESTPSFAQQRAGSNAPKYKHWPWSKPVQATRVIFLECILRPLAAALAHPHVECNPRTLPAEPSIYICNHVTAIDVALVLFALPPRVRRHMAVAMSAELLAAWQQGRTAAGVGAGPLRWLAPLQAQAVTALLNVFPLPAGAGLRQSFAHAGEALDRGYNVLVFPEGKRTLTGELQPFQTGISLLAEESRTAVVPIALAGLWQAAQHPGFFPNLRPSGLVVVVGAPLRRTAEESHSQFAARLRSTVEHLIQIEEKL